MRGWGQQGSDDTRSSLSEYGHCCPQDDEEEEAGYQRREVYHAGARHELADWGQDRFRDLVDDAVDGVVGAEAYPGEDDPQEDRDQQDADQELDEKT